ncbi:hypothetical protein NUW54_g360 [Trametes sanguinea]|uniref:Uncharacterized protein n=1 Tax=Trametes sanguinea TaxID=158606 RepID=A0ACC1Q9C8_9APHY|nr:hypothetical protein NUW54_g360 [Trametes sanguinea]
MPTCPFPIPTERPSFFTQSRILVKASTGGSRLSRVPRPAIYRICRLPKMANNASSGRFYAFTSNTPAPLPPSAASPDPRFRRDGSGSDSVSDDDQSAIGHSYPVERFPQGQGFVREQFGAQNASGFVHHRADPASATFYAEDTPFLPNVQFQASQPSGFIQATPDVPFASPVDQFNPAMAASMTPTTPYGTPYGHSSGDSSPAGSNGSGGSDGSGHMSGSSVGSVSTGVVGYMQPARDPVYHGHDVFAPQQRVGPPPGFNPEYYPAYDEHRRRVGMEHARFGTDPRQPEYAYYRPRTHTYPPVGAHACAAIAQIDISSSGLASVPQLWVPPAFRPYLGGGPRRLKRWLSMNALLEEMQGMHDLKRRHGETGDLSTPPRSTMSRSARMPNPPSREGFLPLPRRSGSQGQLVILVIARRRDRERERSHQARIATMRPAPAIAANAIPMYADVLLAAASDEDAELMRGGGLIIGEVVVLAEVLDSESALDVEEEVMVVDVAEEEPVES